MFNKPLEIQQHSTFHWGISSYRTVASDYVTALTCNLVLFFRKTRGNCRQKAHENCKT